MDSESEEGEIEDEEKDFEIMIHPRKTDSGLLQHAQKTSLSSIRIAKEISVRTNQKM